MKWPGSVYDARIFPNYKLCELLKTGKYLNAQDMFLRMNTLFWCFCWGDPAYQLMLYLMKEYANGGSIRQEQYFGLNLCRARNVTECALGHLKARFGALKRAMDINMETCVLYISASPCTTSVSSTIDREMLIDTEMNAIKQRAREHKTFLQSTLTLIYYTR